MMVGNIDHVRNDGVLVLRGEGKHGPHHEEAADQEHGGQAHQMMLN